MNIDQSITGNANQVTDFLGHTWSFDCMGCAMANHQIDLPGGTIYENDHFLLATDPLVPIPGFLTITVKRHINSFSDLTPTELNEVSKLLVATETALKELGITQLTIVQEERSQHFHIWIFPTYDWMTQKFGPGVSYLRDISDYARTHADQDTINRTLAVAHQVRLKIPQ